MPGTVNPPGIPTIDSADLDARDTGYNGLASTARDLASFLQMLVNRVPMAGGWILSPASAAAMTRPQLGSRQCFASFSRSSTQGTRPARRPRRCRGGDLRLRRFVRGPGDRFARNGRARPPCRAVSHIGSLPAPRSGPNPERVLIGGLSQRLAAAESSGLCLFSNGDFCSRTRSTARHVRLSVDR
jgi:CubicO group peptidase (beta-lactamase class C family)